MANNLKDVLELLISPAQSAFIPNRFISDNIYTAHEIFHYINHKKKGKQKLLTLKLDMRKAYDRVEWEFIDKLLHRFGFADHWVQMVLSCLRSVSYILMINGAMCGKVIPSRGIRQDDPLSLALFILCSQALSSLLVKAGNEGLLKGIQLAEVCHLQECLNIYCKASGQAVNLQKSTLSFSPNVHSKFRRWFSQILKVKYDKGPNKYSGLPTSFGTSKAKLFQEISAKAGKHFDGWKNHLLSHAAKEIMMKSVAFSLSNYASSHFKLPASHHSHLKRTTTNLFWGDGSDKKKIHWISWFRLCLSKQKGGLGFRDPTLYNKVEISWRQRWAQTPLGRGGVF
ncbi:uncharacterized protein LOC122665877 [Telopea speciosissima]|uniref:uncharacterized protein LOC122665877 n=1 Tax=Telopea speciosissima TaxID=54955 RepID=UPI001CC643DE|nr:uncharacterized protein LOC122665877 [Telopea speciosissima]